MTYNSKPELLGSVLQRVLAEIPNPVSDSGLPETPVEEVPGIAESCGIRDGRVCDWAPHGECSDCKSRRRQDELLDQIVDGIIQALPEGADPSTVYLISRKETFPPDSPIVVEEDTTFFKAGRGFWNEADISFEPYLAVETPSK
jgi:hypothetical protein